MTRRHAVAVGSGGAKEQAGQVIRRAREAKGWTAERLAEELTERLPGETVGQSAVSYWETGRNAPRWDKHRAIENALDLDEGELTRILHGEANHLYVISTDQEDPQLSLLGGIWRDLSEDDRRMLTDMAQRLHDGRS